MSAIIETAIGIIFVYLLLSMICSALQEWIAAIFALRAKTLLEGISNMLCSDKNLRDLVYAHPLVAGLSRRSRWDRLLGRSSKPSYMTSQTFSKALLSAAAITPATLAAGSLPDKAPTRDGKVLHENMRLLLNTFLASRPASIDQLEREIEQWFNDAMDRVSGWYKRKTQWIILMIALIVAALSNADTFMLLRAFWSDPALRANVNAAAAQFVKDHPNGLSTTTPVVDRAPTTTAPSSNDAKQKNAHSSSTASNGPAPTNHSSRSSSEPSPTANKQQAPSSNGSPQSADSIAADYPSTTAEGAPASLKNEPAYTDTQRAQEDQAYLQAERDFANTVNSVQKQITDLKIPLGWCTAAAASCDSDHRLAFNGSDSLLKLFGILITVLALSQGSAFWFDVLKKAVNLRLTGDAPDEKKR